MSRRREEIIECPKCGKEHPFVVHESINTTIDPDLKAAVMDGSAFLFECPTCGEKTIFNYGFLYHQMEDKIFICYADSDKMAEDFYKMFTGDNDKVTFEFFIKNDYIIRIVRSQSELLEKIRIFDLGLDDRIIETLKLFALVSFMKSNPNCVKVELFYFKEGNEDFVQIVVDNKPHSIAKIPGDLYDHLCDKYLKMIPDINDDEPYVDRRRALEIINYEAPQDIN